MKEIIQKILEEAVNAPSGDNSQPWRFEVRGNQIYQYNLPKSDNPILNINQRGSYIGHGALLENIKIVASQYKLDVKIDLFPVSSQNDLVAILTLIKNETMSVDPLVTYVNQRRTNRRKYKNGFLKELQVQELKNEVTKITTSDILELLVVQEKNFKKIIGKALSSIEYIILQHQGLHSLLFKDIIWSKNKFEKLRKGFFIGTMEFKPMQKFVFFLASKWTRIKFLNKLGLAWMVVHEDAKLYATGSALCAITIKFDSRENFILAGRVMERVWLKSIFYGLSFHTVTALNFAMLRIKVGDQSAFNEKQTFFIRKNYNDLIQSFKIDHDFIAMTFRIGNAPQPKSIALKLPPQVNYIF